MSARVMFRFPSDTLVRYEEWIPARGDVVHDVAGKLFAVAVTELDGAGGYLATCVTPVQYARETRQRSQRLRAVASGLNDCAHKLQRSTHEQREQRRRVAVSGVRRHIRKGIEAGANAA